jgi:cytochrome bd ubiquinol oxidase subunit II
MAIGLPEGLAGVAAIALNAYALFGGADFGGGVWDLLASGPRRDRQRALIAGAIAPIWEANHVWLILVVVLLFTCFPPVFAALGTVLHIPLTLLLLGIVARGSAFVFRAYGARGSTEQLRWGRLFAGASLITPLLLGVCIGAIASGAVGRAAATGALGIPGLTRAIAADGTPALGAEPPGFVAIFVAPWLSAFTVATGVLALVLFAFLAAVYLTVEADTRGDAELADDFRRRGLISAVVLFVAAFGTLVIAHRHAAAMASELTGSVWSLPLQVGTGVAALAAIGGLLRRAYRLARVAAAAQASCILWGWAWTQYPLLLPPSVSIRAAAAPRETLVLIAWALGVGAIVLLPSLVYLYRLFQRPSDGRAADTSASS